MTIDLKYKDKISLRTSGDIYEIMYVILKEEKRIDCSTKEHLWVISLDVQKKILNIELVGMGSIKSVPASPIEVFSLPVHKKANSVVLVHNHPSGSLMPSAADKSITNRLIQAGLILGIDVDDHLIITEKSYYSFQDSGLLEQLAMDNTYSLTFIREKQFQREIEKKVRELEKMKKKIQEESKQLGIQEGEEKGVKKRNQEIARSLLLQGVDIKVVEKSTGLTRQWVGRLRNEIREKR